MCNSAGFFSVFFFFQAEDGIRDHCVTGVQTCALPISKGKSLTILWIVLAVTILFAAISLAWRLASRIWSLPCPSVTAWRFDNPLIRALTRTTLDRLGLRPGQRILEIGPGPGRLLIPAAERVLPGGAAVGIDIQPGMIERLKARADRAGIKRLQASQGDATQPHVAEVSFDLVFPSTAL